MPPKAIPVLANTSPNGPPSPLPAAISPAGASTAAQPPFATYYVPPPPRYQTYPSLESVTQQMDAATRQIAALSSSLDQFYQTFQAFTSTYNSFVSSAEKQASTSAGWFKKYAEIQVKSSTAMESRVKVMETALQSLAKDREQQAKQIQDTHFATHEILEMLKDREAGATNVPQTSLVATGNIPSRSVIAPSVPPAEPPALQADTFNMVVDSAPNAPHEQETAGESASHRTKGKASDQHWGSPSQAATPSSSTEEPRRLTRSQSNRTLALSRTNSNGISSGSGTIRSSGLKSSLDASQRNMGTPSSSIKVPNLSKRKSIGAPDNNVSHSKRAKHSTGSHVKLGLDGKWPEAVDGSDWIQCDDCNAWYHHGCVGISPADFRLQDDSTKYTCPECVADPDVIVRHENVKVGTQRCHRGNDCGNEDPEGEERYTISRILGKKPGWWLIEWSGYDLDNATWEPGNNLSDPQKLIATFQNSARIKVKASKGTIEVLKEVKSAIPKSLLA